MKHEASEGFQIQEQCNYTYAPNESKGLISLTNFLERKIF